MLNFRFHSQVDVLVTSLKRLQMQHLGSADLLMVHSGTLGITGLTSLQHSAAAKVD